MHARAVPSALRLAAHRSVGGDPCPTSRRHWRGALPSALRLAAHRSVGGDPCPTSRRHWRGALTLAVILALAPAACGGGDPSKDYARQACKGLTKADLQPDVDRLDFLREKEESAAKAANENPRWDALYDARRDLRQATEDRNSKAAVVAGLQVVKECRKVNSG
jgi:hypothetical protein